MFAVILSSSFVDMESLNTTGEILHVIVTVIKSVESGQFVPDKVQEKIFSPADNPLTFVEADVESVKVPVPETTFQ